MYLIRLDTAFGDVAWLTRDFLFIEWGERNHTKAFRSKALLCQPSPGSDPAPASAASSLRSLSIERPDKGAASVGGKGMGRRDREPPDKLAIGRMIHNAQSGLVETDAMITRAKRLLPDAGLLGRWRIGHMLVRMHYLRFRIRFARAVLRFLDDR